MPMLTDLLAANASRQSPAFAAFTLARRRFLGGYRLDMTRLAADLGVSRVTLNRWVGSRDLLIAEILWSLAEPTLEHEQQQSTHTGGALVADAIAGLLRATLSASYMRDFLSREPDIALRIATTDRTPFQHRVSAWTAQLINLQIPPAQQPLPADDLGYLVVRIGESFGYIDHITGGQPDPEKARRAIIALLRPNPVAS